MCLAVFKISTCLSSSAQNAYKFRVPKTNNDFYILHMTRQSLCGEGNAKLLINSINSVFNWYFIY